MKALLKYGCLLVVFAFSGTAFAADITITPANCDTDGGAVSPNRTCWTTDVNSQPSAENLAALTGIPEADLDQLYKSEVGGSDSGPFAGDYDTTYANSADDPQDAWIAWQEVDSIDCSDGCILVVKDGNHSPAVYVFDISDWDGTSAIHIEDFWPNGGAISNVSIWGGGDSNRVPEPGTLALFGLGLFGMGLIRRRRTS